MRRVTIVLVSMAAVVVLVGGTLSVAGADDEAPTIDACYHARTGALRVDVDGDGCHRAEMPITLGHGLSTRRVVAEDVVTGPGFEGVAAMCGPGEVVLGGGYETASIHPDARPITNGPIEIDGLQGWQVTVINESSADFEFWSLAICAPGTSTGY